MSFQGLRRSVVTPRPDSFQHMSGSYGKQIKHDMPTFPLSCMLPTVSTAGARFVHAWDCCYTLQPLEPEHDSYGPSTSWTPQRSHVDCC